MEKNNQKNCSSVGVLCLLGGSMVLVAVFFFFFKKHSLHGVVYEKKALICTGNKTILSN